MGGARHALWVCEGNRRNALDIERHETQQKTQPGSDKPQGNNLVTLLKQKAELDEQIKDQYFREKTFMAIDVQKSTELKKGKAKDDVFLTFDAYHQLVHGATESNNGQVHETAGDGIMCVFDTADDAAKAGIAIVNGMPDFNQTQNRLKKSMVLRIGLNTGRVLYDESRSIGELFDGVIDVAGHLQKEGKGGDLVITQAAYDALTDKNLFVKDKFWSAKQTQLYKYGVQTGMPGVVVSEEDAEYQDLEKVVPLVDAVSGKSSRELKISDFVWVKRPTGVFAEAKITMLQTDNDFSRMVLAIPDGAMAFTRYRSSLRLCIIYERAEAFAKKLMVAPEMLRYTGDVVADASGGLGLLAKVPPPIFWAGMGIIGLTFLLLAVLFLLR